MKFFFFFSYVTIFPLDTIANELDNNEMELNLKMEEPFFVWMYNSYHYYYYVYWFHIKCFFSTSRQPHVHEYSTFTQRIQFYLYLEFNCFSGFVLWYSVFKGFSCFDNLISIIYFSILWFKLFLKIMSN